MNFEKMKIHPSTLFLGIISGIGFTISLLLILFVFSPLAENVPVFDVVDFELAWTKGQITTIFNTWGSAGMKLHANAVYWDFLFIIGYVSLFSGLILLIAQKIPREWQKVGFFVTFAPIFAGVLDIVENSFLLLMLGNPVDFGTQIPLVTGIFATVKFILFYGAVGFFFVEVGYWIYLRVNEKK